MNEPELFDRAQAGDKDAFDTLVSQNQGLVTNLVAKKIRNSLPHYLEGHNTEIFEDMHQEANLKLFSAIKKFDYRKGYKFSTYATSWIMNGIYSGIDKSRMISIPHEVSTVMDQDEEYIPLHLHERVGEALSSTKMSSIDSIISSITGDSETLADSPSHFGAHALEHDPQQTFIDTQLSPEMQKAFDSLTDDEFWAIAIIYEFHEIPAQRMSGTGWLNNNLGMSDVASYMGDRKQGQVKYHHKNGLSKIRESLVGQAD